MGVCTDWQKMEFKKCWTVLSNTGFDSWVVLEPIAGMNNHRITWVEKDLKTVGEHVAVSDSSRSSTVALTGLIAMKPWESVR